MANMVNVKVKGPYALPVSGGGIRTINPGSVVTLDEDTAKEVVKRGMGVMTSEAPFEAPAPTGHVGGFRADGTPLITRPFGWTPEPEHADLGNRLAVAEKQVARPQAGAR